MLHRFRAQLALAPNVVVVSTTSAVSTLGNSLWYYIFPVYLLTLGASVEGVGIFFTGVAGVTALSQLGGGILSDRWSSKDTLVVAGFVSSIGTFLLFVPTLWVAFAGMFVWAAGTGVVSPARFALLASSVSEKKRAMAFSVWLTLANAIAIPAPAIGSVVASRYGMGPLFVVSGLLTGLAALPRFLWIDEPPRRNSLARTALYSSGLRTIWSKESLRAVIIAVIVVTFLTSVSTNFVPIFGERALGLSTPALGLLFSLQLALGAIVLVPAAKVGEWLGLRGVTLVTGVLCAASELGFIFARGFLLVLGTFGIWTSLKLMGTPFRSAWQANETPSPSLGSVSGSASFLSSLAAIGGPVLGGVLYLSGPTFPFVLEAIALGGAMVYLALATRSPSSLQGST